MVQSNTVAGKVGTKLLLEAGTIGIMCTDGMPMQQSQTAGIDRKSGQIGKLIQLGKVGRVDTTFAGEKETTDTVEQEWGGGGEQE